jgi:hypothetical protein
VVSATTIQIIIGLFVFLSLLISSVVLKKFEQPWFSWFLLSLVALCSTLFVHFQFVAGWADAAQKMMTTSMILFALVSLWHFYDVMGFTQ